MRNYYKIEIKNLTKLYKIYKKPTDRVLEALRFSKKKLSSDFYAISSVSFSLKDGEILGIMGRNGAGKSTLLKMLTGVLTPTYGEIKFKGKISSLLELGAGFNPEYSGIENIFFYGALMGMTSAQMESRMDQILEFAEIGEYIYQPVKTYSSGMFARLAFSCAINVDPDILIVDEILSVGDIRFQAKCFNKFKEFKSKGVTILYVGHDIALMRTFCDTCMWLEKGKVVDFGDPNYIASKYTEFMYSDAPEEVLEEEVLPEEDCLSRENKLNKEYDNFVKKNTPLAHWGRETGFIKNIKLTDLKNNDLDYFAPHDQIKISFDIEIPPQSTITARSLSAAFSIKSKEGIDMIVKTTYDEGVKLRKKEKISVEFTLTTLLNSGDYYLVVALEDRRDAVISYYEYIDGAKYFKIYSDNKIYGLFSPPTKIAINVVAKK